MDYTQIINTLKSLINENTSAEEIETITKVSIDIQSAEKEHNELMDTCESLRQKYIKAIQNSAFPEKPESNDPPKAKTFEDCVQEQIDKRS